DKKGNAKPSAFSHVSTKGCSIQRDTLASDTEPSVLVKKFIAQPNANWKGVMTAPCEAVRSLTAPDSDKRAVCVFDTAEKDNHAHAELCQTEHIVEADELEVRRTLLSVFGDGKIVAPADYRGGALLRR